MFDEKRHKRNIIIYWSLYLIQGSIAIIVTVLFITYTDKSHTQNNLVIATILQLTFCSITLVLYLDAVRRMEK